MTKNPSISKIKKTPKRGGLTREDEALRQILIDRNKGETLSDEELKQWMKDALKD